MSTNPSQVRYPPHTELNFRTSYDVIFEKLTNDKIMMDTNSLSEIVRNKLIYAYERESSEQELKNLKQELEMVKATVSKLLGASIHRLITHYKFIRMNVGDKEICGSEIGRV